jgi:hypothetical protein
VEVSNAYCATKFLSKYADLSTSFDLNKVAFEKFTKYENLCKQTNRRFRNLQCDQQFTGPIVQLHSAVVRKIERILGDFSAEEYFSNANWGPGATTLLKASLASSTNKFQCEIGITRDLYSLLLPREGVDFIEDCYPLWRQQLRASGFPEFQVGNKVVTVPKDSSSHRVIAIEPGLNLWFQKSIGEMIGKRLRRYGIDLRYQSKNQELARKGSIDSHLATLDFSSASDSISLEVIREVLPPRWFSLMDCTRSHYGKQGDSLVKWEKFSSMGNGFTFQLESLLFYAIAQCCMEQAQQTLGFDPRDTVSVYGDDVIIPARCLALFSSASEFYGFKLNIKKSHFSSYFRESCGAHYCEGIDVKPIYFKNRLSSAQSVFRLANAVRRLASRRNVNYGCDARFRTLFSHLVHSVPKRFRFRIPETLGDGGFISNFDEATPVRARHCIEGYFVVHLLEVSKTYQEDRVGRLLSRLWPTSVQPVIRLVRGRARAKLDRFLVSSSTSEQNNVPIRGRTKLRLSRALVNQWKDLGPWI